jgi:hypothetical protein
VFTLHCPLYDRPKIMGNHCSDRQTTRFPEKHNGLRACVCVCVCVRVCVYQHETAQADIGIIPPKDKVNIFGIFEYPIFYCMYSPNTNKEISALLSA